MDFNLPVSKRTRRGQALIYRELYQKRGRKNGNIDNGVESASGSSFTFPKSRNQKLSETESAAEIDDLSSRKDGGNVVDSVGSYSYLNISRKKKISTDDMEDGSENCLFVTTSDGECFDSVQSNSSCCRDALAEKSPPEGVVHNDIDEDGSVSEDSDITEPLTDVLNGDSADDDYQKTESSSSYTSVSEGTSEVSVQGAVNTEKCRETDEIEGMIREDSGGVGDFQFQNEGVPDVDTGVCDSGHKYFLNVDACDDSNCVARRTRSHYDPFCKGRNGVFGTFSRPFCIDGDCDDYCDDWDGAFVPNSSDDTAENATFSRGNHSGNVDSLDINCSSDRGFRRRKYHVCRRKRDFHTPGGNSRGDDLSRRKHFHQGKTSHKSASFRKERFDGEILEGGLLHSHGGGNNEVKRSPVCENENSVAPDPYCQILHRDNEKDEHNFTEVKMTEKAEKDGDSTPADYFRFVRRCSEKYQVKQVENINRNENDVATDHCHFGEGDNGKGGSEATEPTKKKDVCRPSDFDVIKIIVDSIWDKGEILLDDMVFSKDNNFEFDTNPPLTTKLPLKFSFGTHDSNNSGKTEISEELDKLWTEFDFILKYDGIGSTGSSLEDNEDQCKLGEHHFVLDDQIGIVCKLCSFVKLEIKHILPSLSAHRWGKAYRHRGGQKEYNFMFDELQSQDPGEGTECANDSFSNATTGTVWDIIPGSFAALYPHQRDGFEFLWRNVAGDIYLDKLNKSLPSAECGNGCVISHAPGTGKTKLTIVFIQAYMHLFPNCRPVIIAPKSMLLTWEEEFKKWNIDITFHNLNKPELTGEESWAAVNILKQLGSVERSVSSLRLVKLYSWKKNKSILGVSYRLFEQLAGRNRRRPESEEVKKILLELPGLLILDEGHTPRNDQSLIWKALSKIETQKRIILSGTPFQNNFRELYNTLCLVRPKFADKFLSDQYRSQEHKGGKKNLARGKWTSLMSLIGTPTDDDMLNHIRDIIDPFVHVHKGSILQERLLGLTDSVVVLRPSHLQKIFIEKYTGYVKNALELGYFVSLISVHPSLLPLCFPEDVEKTIDRAKLEKHRLNPNSGVKTKFLMELIRLSETLNEKVLVFSQYIDPLSFIIDLLKSHFGWTEGKEILYMNGQLNVKQRQASINIFNQPTGEARILFASIRACSEGINLVGASRVVLLDVVWNPSVERQAISRAYRLGQTRVVYIYHLITAGTMEGEKYCRQAGKDRLSELVFSSVDGDGHSCKMSSTVPEDKVLEALVQHETLKYMFEKIIYQPKESDLIESFGLVD